MCDCKGCRPTKKEAKDYLCDDDNVNFVKTYDGVYTKQSALIKYFWLKVEANNYVVKGCSDINCVVIEKFTSQAEAELFLKELLEGLIE